MMIVDGGLFVKREKLQGMKEDACLWNATNMPRSSLSLHLAFPVAAHDVCSTASFVAKVELYAR